MRSHLTSFYLITAGWLRLHDKHNLARLAPRYACEFRVSHRRTNGLLTDPADALSRGLLEVYLLRTPQVRRGYFLPRSSNFRSCFHAYSMRSQPVTPCYFCEYGQSRPANAQQLACRWFPPSQEQDTSRVVRPIFIGQSAPPHSLGTIVKVKYNGELRLVTEQRFKSGPGLSGRRSESTSRGG